LQARLKPTKVEPLAGLRINDRILALLSNIRLGRK
jgi:hypothetical protein